MGDHRCENCGKMFYTRYVQYIGNCFCPECRAKMGAAKKEKEYGEAKEYWGARKKEAGLLIASIGRRGKNTRKAVTRLF